MCAKPSIEHGLYNTIMPESDDRVLCMQIDKPITAKGYDENFLPRIEAMLKKTGEIRMLIYYKSFKGWEKEAAMEDMVSLAKYRNQIVKCALVNPPKSEMFKTKLREPAIKGEVKFFSAEQLKEAVDWVRA